MSRRAVTVTALRQQVANRLHWTVTEVATKCQRKKRVDRWTERCRKGSRTMS